MRSTSRVTIAALCGLLIAGGAHAQVAPPTVVVPMQTGTTSNAISNETAPRLDQKKGEAEAQAADRAKAAEKDMGKAAPATPPAPGK